VSGDIVLLKDEFGMAESNWIIKILTGILHIAISVYVLQKYNQKQPKLKVAQISLASLFRHIVVVIFQIQ